jgi:branched-chain amino acid transport system substrate-binding protein
MRRFIAVAIAILAVAVVYPAQAEVLIGVVGPMTGKVAVGGEQIQRGTELAVADINAAGGVLGEKVRVITADDFCDPAQAVIAARKLASEGVVGVFGSYCSGATIAESEVFEKAGILQITPAASNPMITELGRANVFRVISRDDADGIVAGNYLADHWSDKKIAILHDDTTFGKGLADLTRKQLHQRGVKEAIYQAYAPGNNDYSAEIAALQAANIDVLYVGGYHTEVALIARAARDRGYSVQLVSGNDMATEEVDLIAGPAAEGILFTYVADPRRNPEAAPVVERFQAEYFEPEGYTLFSYGAVQAWAQAVEKAGSLKLKAVIASLRNNQFDTVLGRIDLDEKGDLTSQSPISRPIWYVWKGGKYLPLE